MNKKANLLERIVRKDIKKLTNLRLNTPLVNNNNFVDYFDTKSAKYNPVPLYAEDRIARMNQIKQKLDLSFIDNFNKKCILNKERVGDDRDGMVFKRINPITDLNNQIRPNSFSWTVDQYNKRIIGKMIQEKEDSDKSKINF